MNFGDLSPELQEKVKACATPEELNALAESEGFELTDDDLQAVAGGNGLRVGDFCPFDEFCRAYDCGKDSCSTFGCGVVSCERLDCSTFYR